MQDKRWEETGKKWMRYGRTERNEQFHLKEREEGRRKRMMIGQPGYGQEILEEDLAGNVDNE
jgi:hypothetical protein